MAQKSVGFLSKRIGLLVLPIVLVIGPAAQGVPPSIQAMAGSPSPDSIAAPHVPGEVIVGFKARTSDSERASLHAELNATIVNRIPELHVDVVRSRSGDAADTLMQRYSLNPLIEYVQPNYLHHLTSTPNDPKYPQQWALNNNGQSGACNPVGTFDSDIDAPEAWSLQTGSSTIIVGVIDSGINYSHPDLSGNIWSNPGESNCGNGIDDDGNGYIDDCRGWDFVNGDNAPLDDYGHGTHVAGIIGAMGNNALGVSGVAWTVKLIPLKAFGTSGTGQSDWIANAILYARDKGARAINYSAGGAQDSAIDNAISASPGVLFVSAAGSQLPSGQDEDTHHFYPCDSNFANIVCVTDTDQNDVLDPLANWGATTVDLGAPGVNILSTAISTATVCNQNYDPANALACCTGTSMAVPHVSGAAALMFAQRSSLSVAGAKAILINTVDPITALAGKSVSGGRLNLFRAVQSASDTTPPSAPGSPTATYAAGPVSLSWSASTDNVGVHHYEVLRTAQISVSYAVIGSSATTSFSDATAAANKTYLYKVRAVDAAGNVSANSSLDIATTFAFTDPTLTAGAVIRGVHITDLRTAIGYLRTAAGLGAYSYTDPTITAGSTAAKAVHINDLRTAVDAARAALGLSTGGYTETITPGQTSVKVVHITELRTRTQ